MIDLKATNIKLQQRAKNILRFVGGAACTQSDEELEHMLVASSGSVKLAAASIVLGVSVEEAKKRLEKHHGVLARVFDEERERQRHGQSSQCQGQGQGLMLCVDAGGTSCKAVVTAEDGSMGHGVAGPCNVSHVGIDAALSTMALAIQKAVDTCSATRGRQWQSVSFSSAWVGMAGYARPALAVPIQSALSEMLKMSLEDNKLRVTTDIDMLPAALATDESLDSVIVLVAGTGSIAMSYEKLGGTLKRTGRAGGWGHLLGDDGSGYWLGREALRIALGSADNYAMQLNKGGGGNLLEESPLLYRRIVEHFQSQHPNSRPQDLLSTVVMPEAAAPHNNSADQGATPATTKRIAGVAPVVLSLRDTDDDARRIVDAGVSSLAKLVVSLFRAGGNVPSKTGLVLAGGMMRDEKYRETLLMSIKAEVGAPKRIEVVEEPAAAAAEYLRLDLGS
jgi:N-acetylmuramic acid 6-phosphate etherase